jgi:hypothetical protein
MSYIDFNDYNCAPVGVRNMIVEGENGKIGYIPIPEAMRLPNKDKLYSFMALSDAHINWGAANNTEDADNDFIRAMEYANNSDVSFVCICGDVVDGGTADINYSGLLGRYKDLKDRYAQKPVRAITGNHECRSGDVEVSEITQSWLNECYGDDLYYSFPWGNDVFIMLGEHGWVDNKPFADGELEWFETELEKYKDKRCFVFFHVFHFDINDSGLPTKNFYGYDIFEHDKEQKEKFFNLLKKYKNTIWFHGHSHAKFELQTINKNSNYSELCGFRSVHIPSLSKPRSIINGTVEIELEGSQGYIVDVYDEYIALRGIDFVKGKFLPIATYKIDTTLTL